MRQPLGLNLAGVPLITECPTSFTQGYRPYSSRLPKASHVGPGPLTSNQDWTMVEPVLRLCLERQGRQVRNRRTFLLLAHGFRMPPQKDL